MYNILVKFLVIRDHKVAFCVRYFPITPCAVTSPCEVDDVSPIFFESETSVANPKYVAPFPDNSLCVLFDVIDALAMFCGK